MIPALRQAFNAKWSAGKYGAFLQALDARCGTHVKFRVCETPCFFPQALIAACARAGAEMLEQLLGDAAYRRASNVTIPAQYNVKNEAARPLFAAVDFGLVRTASGVLEPRLVEIQGFPSLYCFQVALAQQFVESYGLEDGLGIVAGAQGGVESGKRRLERELEEYWAILRRAVLGEHQPENVVLLEIDPLEQKTLPDFLLTERQLGVRAVNIRDVEKEGRRLFYVRDGKRVPIERIYNRAIVDELERKQVALPFRFTDELDVEWAGHPNWFFRISKFSIPFLKHAFVPQTWFLDQVERLPEDLENYVLKPLYSFAGLGVVVGPTRAEVESVPRERRHDYILQRRMRFEPVIETPHGATQAEIRVLYIDRVGANATPPQLTGKDNAETHRTQRRAEVDGVTGAGPTLGANGAPRVGHPKGALGADALANWALGPLIIRMGRGKMMGVDHNRDLEWVGASAGLIAAT